MKLKAMLTAVLTLSLLITTVGAFAASADGDFLSDRASDVSQVIFQVEANRLIALRYAKHFGTDPSSVLEYMRNELQVKALDKDTSIEVYNIGNSGSIEMRSLNIKAGTKVFTNNAGTPVLEYGTGNPLTNRLPKKGALTDIAKQQTPAAAAGTVPEAIDQTASSVLPATTTNEAARNESPVLTGEGSPLPSTVVAMDIPGAAASIATSSAASSGASFSGLLVPIGVIGGAAAMLGAGGGGGPRTIDNQVNEPVPEPCGLIVLGSGMTALAGIVSRKHRK